MANKAKMIYYREGHNGGDGALPGVLGGAINNCKQIKIWICTEECVHICICK
jgi:hypothetical protein